MKKVSLERYYFVLYDGALTLKISKMPLNSFCDKTLHIFQKQTRAYILYKMRRISKHRLNKFLQYDLCSVSLTIILSFDKFPTIGTFQDKPKLRNMIGYNVGKLFYMTFNYKSFIPLTKLE